MIDVENIIFTKIAGNLRTKFKGITVSGEYINAPSKFPYVSVVEQDNYSSTDKLDSSIREKFATVMYEVNVYSNKSGYKKSEAREIMGEIDKMFIGMNFKRLSLNPVPNMENATIYRLVARYKAETDGTTLYRR